MREGWHSTFNWNKTPARTIEPEYGHAVGFNELAGSGEDLIKDSVGILFVGECAEHVEHGLATKGFAMLCIRHVVEGC